MAVTPAGFPDAKTTGVPAGTVLKAYTGPMTITTDGTVIDGALITGSLVIAASNVIIKNSQININSWWGVDAEHAKGLTIQDTDFVGPGYSGSTNAAILGSGTFLRNDISKTENGIVLTNGASVVKGNFIHDLQAAGADPHYDGISVQGGQNGVLIEGNTVLGRDTSDIFIKNDFGTISNVKVVGNYLGGDAGYALYVNGYGTGGAVTNVEVTGNYVEKAGWGSYFAVDKTSPNIHDNFLLGPNGEGYTAPPTTGGSAPTPPQPTPPPVTTPTPPVSSPGPSTPAPSAPTSGDYVLRVSGDSFKGDPKFIVKVDGVQVGGVMSTHASHANGEHQDIKLQGVTGDHAKVTVQFVNDYWEGTPSTDRNLFVESVTHNGKTYVPSSGTLLGNGTATIDLGSPKFTGGIGKDTLNGDTKANVISGLGGNDVLNGKAGNDTLLGGAGQDKFMFDTALNASTNVDKLSDFNVDKDLIGLDRAIFKALGPGWLLSESDFHVGASAATKADHLIYNSKSGALLYDADGAGGNAAVQFATLAPNLHLTHHDFFVV